MPHRKKRINKKGGFYSISYKVILLDTGKTCKRENNPILIIRNIISDNRHKPCKLKDNPSPLPPTYNVVSLGVGNDNVSIFCATDT